ncbi:tight junction protein ZO-2 isoform X4 [Hermetia illucens]|uniref:tight junction protein ZO-2 isoform X4 n=1 Tax=Hermetia illucens TaxID=343691 RepID=UPI0018CC1299|nr:tight junction protein ZO-2 isoform X4 [Hermetia illucens]
MARGAEEEEEEVRSLLSRHRSRIILDLKETDLVAVLVKNSVISGSEEDLLKDEGPKEDDSEKGKRAGSDECGDESHGVGDDGGSEEAPEKPGVEVKCSRLIDLIAKSGFEKFKQFCYAIENECPQLIEDLINDRLKYDGLSMPKAGANASNSYQDTTSTISNATEAKDPVDIAADSDKDTSDRSHRSLSYGGSVNITPPVAAPRKGVKSISPIPTTTPTNSQPPPTPELPITKLPPDQVNLNQKVDSISKFNQSSATSNSSNYSSLLCHNTTTTTSPATVRKRDKILHRFSDAATIGRKLKKKKNTSRPCRSMAEPIEVLADPVVEDDFFTDRTSWEYHTVAITRVPGYGFGIAVSGGRDNPHFANGDPSIAVSDVLKGGPAEERLQVNDRIISVNGVSLENVEYATAVQVLRDSGNTVTLVVKRRVANLNLNPNQHSHSMSSVGLTGGGGILTAGPQPAVVPGQPIKVVLTKASKKEDFGIVLGCRLFIKEITSKARDQLAANGYSLQEGDIITRLNNTNCSDTMNMKEAKKIIDGCKERLNLVVLRDVTNQNISNNNLNNAGLQTSMYSHTQQLSNCSNNLDEAYLSGNAPGYSSQNLYVQPPTRGITSPLADEKNNLTPRGRSRGPLTDVALSQLDRPSTPPTGNSPRRQPNVDDPPRPPPPRNEEFYSSRRQLYEDDPLQRSRQSAEPRFISFQKEGSVGIRLTGGNEAGIFVTAVQPGSPASLQGLTPGDKILKVNDMDMHGVTREEAVLFLLSLQDRIDLIVQHCKEEYDEVVANQRGDSFHIKTHFHCDSPSKGEMAFKAGDVFRVIDTLHNGVVGSWQVLKIGRGHQEMQRGVIPNKSRAEELATAQFNATKKEMNASESRGNFFRRRRSTHRRSKSLSRENWDDVVFSDAISKFAAYERVVLRHPGFVRPVVIFGPVADLAREKLAKDFPDKFTSPLQDDDKSNAKCRIVRLSNIRDIMDRGKHALLDITPNAVDRLNYAQFYPIVIFLKTDSKHIIKQLRRDVPKSAHKSSKKLLEQCGKLDKVWSHIFSTTIVLNETDSWYRKLRDAIDLQQSGAVWMSESKPVESLSDDFLFPMSTSRLSYASSPESDLELSPGPSASLSLGNLPQLVKSSSDPSIATNQDNLDRDRDIGEGLPPYAHPYNHSNAMSPNRQPVDGKFGFSGPGNNPNQSTPENTVNRNQPIYGMNAPDLPPRIDRASKPPGGVPILSAAVNNQMRNGNSSGTLGRSAQERLFGKQGAGAVEDGHEEYATRPTNTDSMERNAENSLDRQRHNNVPGSGAAGVKTPGGAPQPLQNGSYDSVSSYDSYNTTQIAAQNIRLGPNAPDDLKSVPAVNTRIAPTMGTADYRDPSMANRNPIHEHPRNLHEHIGRGMVPGGPNDLNRQSSPGRPLYDINSSRNIDNRNPHDVRGMNIPQRPSNLGLESSPRKQIVETKTDYGKYRQRLQLQSQIIYLSHQNLNPSKQFPDTIYYYKKPVFNTLIKYDTLV